MFLKPVQEVWYELWEAAGSRGLDTWYAPERRRLRWDTNCLLEADGDETESDSGGG
jgi:hypothetical protein